MALNDDLNNAANNAGNLNDELRDAVSIAGEINDIWSSTMEGFKKAQKSFNEINNIGSQIASHQDNINKLTKKEINELKNKLSLEKESLKSAQKQIDAQINQLLSTDKLTKAQQNQLQKLDAMNDAIHESVEGINNMQKGLNSLKPISPFSKKGEEQFEKFKEFVKKQKESIKSAFSLSNIYTQIKNLILGLDESAGKFAKSMNVSYQEALLVREEMGNLRDANQGVMANAKDYMETLSFVGDQLGSNAQLNKEDLVTFTKLREQAGLTNEELMGMQKISLSNGKNLEQNTKEFLAQAKITSLNNKVILNEKQLLKEIGKVTAATTLSLGKNPKQLAEAVATAKSLGMEMSQLEKISDSLLEFESSITDELNAELLVGKDLNLEKARLLALNNDLAGVAEEVASQVGSAAEFGKMNRIQQEALAKAVGMSRDQLAETLFTQEQLKGLSEEQAEKREALLQKRIQEVGLEQAQKELQEDGIEKLEQQATLSEAFQKTVERIKEEFQEIVQGPLQDFLNASGGVNGLFEKIQTKLKTWISYGKEFLKIMLSIKAAQLAYNTISGAAIAIQKTRQALAKREAGASIISTAMKSFSFVPLVGTILALAAAGTAYTVLSSYMDDGIIPPRIR